MNNKILFLFTLLILLIILGILILFRIFATSNKTNTDQEQLSPSITQENNDELIVTRILPSPNNQQSYFSGQKISITFNRAVTPQNISITTTPETQTRIMQGETENEIFIIPDPRWQNGSTNITMGATSEIGEKLKSPLEYTIITAAPTVPQEAIEDFHP